MQKALQYQQSVISYTAEGSGQAIVLLHGFGEDSSIWERQKIFLQKRFKVIVPDLPGSGKSGLLKKENVGMEDYAGCIKALLKHEQIESCILLGHSMGGYVTLAFAEMFPGKLIGFGLVNSTAFADSADKKEVRKQGIQLISQHGAYSFLKKTTPHLFSKNFKASHCGQVEALIENGRQFSNEALVQYYTAMMNRPDRTRVLKDSAVPVLFVTGTEDIAAPLSDLLQQVHLPQTSHIHIMKGISHMSMMEAPEKLNEHLLEFSIGSLFLSNSD